MSEQREDWSAVFWRGAAQDATDRASKLEVRLAAERAVRRQLAAAVRGHSTGDLPVEAVIDALRASAALDEERTP